jgi:hypothetical protein
VELLLVLDHLRLQRIDALRRAFENQLILQMPLGGQALAGPAQQLGHAGILIDQLGIAAVDAVHAHAGIDHGTDDDQRHQGQRQHHLGRDLQILEKRHIYPQLAIRVAESSFLNYRR